MAEAGAARDVPALTAGVEPVEGGASLTALPGGRGVERGWFSRAELAAIFGVSISQVDRHYVLLAPPDACRKLPEGKTAYNARAIIDAVVEAEVRKKGAALKAELSGGDPMLDGTATPALEKFRQVKTQQEMIRLAEMEKKSVPLERLEPALLGVAGVLRRYGEVLKRKFGNGAVDVLNEAVGEWEAGCAKLLAQHGTGAKGEEGGEGGGGGGEDDKSKT